MQGKSSRGGGQPAGASNALSIAVGGTGAEETLGFLTAGHLLADAGQMTPLGRLGTCSTRGNHRGTGSGISNRPGRSEEFHDPHFRGTLVKEAHCVRLSDSESDCDPL